MSQWRELNSRPLPYQGSALPLSYIGKFVGRAGFEPTKAYASRFTVCPSWPLWYLPNIF